MKYGKGDSGETDLFGAGYVRKSNLRIDCCGELDELSSFIGLARSMLRQRHNDIDQELKIIQQHIFIIGAELAAVDKSKLGIKVIGSEEVEYLQRLIARYESFLPQLHHFVNPTGSLAASGLHVARAVARRVERRIVELSDHEEVNPEIIRYLNRLSTLLFVLARAVNLRDGFDEEVWLGREIRP